MKQVAPANPDNSSDCDIKSSKKTRAPNPPPSPDEHELEFGMKLSTIEKSFNVEEPLKSYKEIVNSKATFSSLIANTAIVPNSNFQLKEKPYPTINPKFRSLNNLSSKENNEQEKIKKPSTPEPAPRHSLSLSQDCLAMDADKNKKKNKFSIKKFLRMGNSNKQVEPAKRDYGHYADVATFSEVSYNGAPQVKPRLIIIHPLDINTSAVQVVKSADVTPTSTPSPQTPTSIGKNIFPNLTSKPPAPPQRADTTKLQELHKPARPPPPKSAEMRRKQQLTNLVTVAQGPVADNVYANLGEVRSAIAPRKPERTASMREREAKLEIMRRRPIGDNADSLNSSFSSTSTTKDDSFSSGSSRNGSEKSFSLHKENKEKEEDVIDFKEIKDMKETSIKSTTDSFNERKKKILEMETNISMNSTVTPQNKLSSKIEIFESNTKAKSPAPIKHSTYFVNNDGLKSSVQKMTSTIDSYLKNKKTLSASDTNLLQEQPVTNGARNTIKNNANNVSNIELRASSSNNYETITISGGTMTNGLKQAFQRASFPDTGSNYGGESQNGSLYRNGRHSQDFGIYAAPANNFGEFFYLLFIAWKTFTRYF